MMNILKKLDPLVAAIAAIAIVGALLYVFWPSSGTKTIYADFPRTVSVYQGSDVRILGVPVGKVDSVTPMGQYVRIKMEYADKYTLPANVTAMIISPSIVGDRYVQFTPAIGTGAFPNNGRLGCGTTCGESGPVQTAVPLELDEIYGSLSQFAEIMGPGGANAPGASGQGALTRLLNSTAANFGGQGQNFNNTIQNLGRLSQTLNENKDNLFGTQAAVEKFVSALAKNDGTVRAFTQALTEGASMLSQDRQDLGSALDNLATALEQVRGFVAENRASLTSNIAGLTRISETLVKRRDQLAEILRTAPLALNNLALAYNAKAGTLDTRANVNVTASGASAAPGKVICAFLQAGLGTNASCPLGRSAYAQIRSAQQANSQSVDMTLAGLVAP